MDLQLIIGRSKHSPSAAQLVAQGPGAAGVGGWPWSTHLCQGLPCLYWQRRGVFTGNEGVSLLATKESLYWQRREG